MFSLPPKDYYYLSVKALYTVGYSTSLVSLTTAMVILCRFRWVRTWAVSCSVTGGKRLELIRPNQCLSFYLTRGRRRGRQPFNRVIAPASTHSSSHISVDCRYTCRSCGCILCNCSSCIGLGLLYDTLHTFTGQSPEPPFGQV